MRDHGAPEDQHVEAGILPAGGGVVRHGARRLRRRGPPRLDPGHATGLQLRNDLAGDFVIQARPIVAGARRRISASGAGGLSSSPQPVAANSVRTLTLKGALRGSPLRSLGSLPESSLLFKVDRRDQMDELASCLREAPCLAASSFITIKDVPLNEDLVGVAINILPVSETRTVAAFS